jgi:hypothetical protein
VGGPGATPGLPTPGAVEIDFASGARMRLMSNQSHANSNRVSGVTTRILKIGDQRLACEFDRFWAKLSKIAPQRLRDVSLTNSQECREYLFHPDMPLRDATGWLGRQDSNLRMSFRKMPFEMSHEFRLI